MPRIFDNIDQDLLTALSVAKSSTFAPRFIRNGEIVDQPHGHTISLVDKRAAGFVNCLINSSIFYWSYSTLADCEHINDSLVRGFPLPNNLEATDWSALSASVDSAELDHIINYDIKYRMGQGGEANDD